MKIITAPFAGLCLTKVVLDVTGRPVAALVQGGHTQSNGIAIDLAMTAPDVRVIAWLAQETRVEATDAFRAVINDAWPRFRSELLQDVHSLIAIACLRMMEDDLEMPPVRPVAAEGIAS